MVKTNHLVMFIYASMTFLLLALVGCGGGGGGTAAPATATLQSIAVTPANPSIVKDRTQQFTATGIYSDGTSVALTTGITWTSSNTLVATVTNGLATGVAVGTATITAASGTIFGSATLTVIPFMASLTDPLATQQWHLKNTGQKSYADVAGIVGMDINVEPVYSTWGLFGAGVTVAVVDSGLEIAHEDLTANVVPGGSWNFNTSTTDPTNTATTGDHGTSVSGLIAMARNTVGGIGVASAASLKGFNLLSSSQLLSYYVASLGGSTASPNSSDVAVFNLSYGTNEKFDYTINTTVEAQYASGASTLRAGKGALYVKSAGNGFTGFGSPAAVCGGAIAIGVSCQNANFDPDNTIPYNIVVGATEATGVKSSYSTAGSALWVSAPGGEYGRNASVNPGLIAAAYKPAMVTADQSGCTNGYSRTSANTSTFNNGGAPNTICNYTNTMNGTSSAAPVTSGVIALMLNANPNLTWRDVKRILASTARQLNASIAAVTVALSNGNYTAEQAWVTNAAGYKFHNWYGFGMVDANAAVTMARTYAVNLGTFTNTGWISSGTISLAIPDNSVNGTSGAGSTLTVPAISVEAVQIKVSVTHPYTGDLGIELTSPSGTKSILKNIRDGFDANVDLVNMVLVSNAFYDEAGAGGWTIKVVDGNAEDIPPLTLTNWQIRIYGR